MTKSEFLAQLSDKLRVLPVSDQQDALEYYEGYISDAENEAAAIAELGNPNEVAATILANYVSHQNPKNHNHSHSHTPPRGRRKIKTAYIAIFAIFAVPIGIPLAATAFGLIVALLAIIFSVVVTGVALLAAGGVALISSPFVLFRDFWFGLFLGGLGIASLGLGFLAFKGGIKLAGGFPVIMQAIRRRGRNSDTTAPKSIKSPWGDPQYSNSAPTPPESTGPESTGKMGDQQYSNSMPASTQETSHVPYISKGRRLPGVGFALLLILAGAAMFGLAFHNGARGGYVSWSNGRFNVVSANSSSHRGQVREVPLSGSISEAHITVSTRNVVILPSDTPRVIYTGDPTLDININNGVLNISQNSTGTRNIYFLHMDLSPRGSHELRVYLPLDFYSAYNSRISARTTTGNIRIEGNVPNINAIATTGNITIADNGLHANTIDLRTTTGRINVNNIHHANNLYATATTGNISIEGITSSVGTINMRTTTGRITASAISSADYIIATSTTGNITVQNIDSNVNLIELRTTTGRQTIENVPHIADISTIATTGNVTLTNLAWAYLNTRTTTGRVNITRGQVLCYNNSGTTTRITATTGNVNADIRNDENDFRTNLTSSSGRIQLNGRRLADRGTIGMGTGSSALEIRTTSGRIDVSFGG